MTRKFLAQLMATRVPQLGAEIHWAMGQPMPGNFRKPPPWVKNAITECFTGSTKPKSAGKITLTSIVTLLGHARGLTKAATAMLKDPATDAGISLEARSDFHDLKSAFLTAIKPSVDEARKIDSGLTERLCESSVENTAAHTMAEAAGVALVSDSADADVKDLPTSSELTWILWIAWPHVQTAKSINEIHQWLAGLGIFHCSPKLTEKICHRLGLRPSGRGRKKRIPTGDA